jgi:gamma-glutamylcyclotransferase (GGCT)/AIG2-like uncharacterized protein YtfP
MEKVFVYGTLKKGYHNNHLLNGHEPKQAKAPGINLYKGPGFPFAKRGTGTAIGEVYEIDEQTLKMLDRLEGHPAFYKREKTKVICGGQYDEAWIYLYPDANKYPKIEGGEWK